MSERDEYKYGVPQIEITDVKLTDGQQTAINKINLWRRMSNKKPYFVLGGGAGTGKSTLLRYIAEIFDNDMENVLFCSLTGKAALCLRRMGLDAKTIHNSIYKAIVKQNPETKKFYIAGFKKRKFLNQKVVIVDEASMVSKSVFEDLLSFGRPVIFVGDPYQLPPIKDDFNIMLECDYVLSEIMRQSAESQIIQLAYKAKAGDYISAKTYSDDVVCLYEKDLNSKDITDAGQIIVGTNKRRSFLNLFCREELGFGGDPKEGEKMIFLKNDYSIGVHNGQIVYLTKNAEPAIKKYKKNNLKKMYNITYLDEFEYNDPYFYFKSKPKEATVCMEEVKGTSLLINEVIVDYGYAITGHKAQGSQYDDVLIYGGFGGWDKELARHWLYTSITRAIKSLKIVYV